IAGQLADLFAAAVKAHGLAALPRLPDGILQPEVMHDLIDGGRAGVLNLRRYNELKIGVRAGTEVALQETARAGDRGGGHTAGPWTVGHTVPTPVMPERVALLHEHLEIPNVVRGVVARDQTARGSDAANDRFARPRARGHTVPAPVMP